MTNEDIESYIDALNRNDFSSYIFRSKLSDKVDFARVWAREPENMILGGSYQFYFIKNNEGKYVAAVLDMYRDLHVFVKTKYRKQGHLSLAINEVILPHIGRMGREKQVITFEDPSIGEYCIRNWGFSLIGESTAEKSLTIYHNLEPMPYKGYKLSGSDYRDIATKIRMAKSYIKMVKEQLDASLSEIDNTDEIYLDIYVESELSVLKDSVLTLIEEVEEIRNDIL